MINEYLAKIIYFFMTNKRSLSKETEQFKYLKHNFDLCPRIQDKLCYIVDSLNKYRNSTYDIQGFKDEGTDIVIRMPSESSSSTKYICLQVKSQDDIDKSDYLAKLKQQVSDSYNDYSDNIVDYYIILCCNSNHESTKNKIRMIESSFNKRKDVHIIEPEYAIEFINLRKIKIDSLLKGWLSEEDVVFRTALNTVSDLIPTEKALLFFIIWNSLYLRKEKIDLDHFVNSSFIANVYERTPNYHRRWFFEEHNGSRYSLEYFTRRDIVFQERVLLDLEYLTDNFINLENDNSYSILLISVPSLIALMMDANVRYEYSDYELLQYMMDLLENIDD